MSDKLKWLSEGIDRASLASLLDNSVMPLATDDPGGDTCGGYSGCNLYSCSTDGGGCSNYGSCTSDSATCTADTPSASVTLTASGITKTSVTLTSSGAGSPSKTRYWTFTCGGETKVVSNQSTSASVTFTGLSPGTTYSATCRYGPASNQTQYSGGSCTFTTDSPQLLPSGTASLSLVSSTANSLKVKVSGMGTISATRTFYWYLDGRRIDYTTGVSGSTTSATYEFTGLSPNTSYQVEFRYKRTGDEYDTYYTTSSFQTKEEYNYSLKFTTSATATSVTATVSLTSGTTTYDVDCTFTLDGARYLDATISAGQTSRTRTWTTDITPATAYTVGLKDNLRNLSWTQKRRTKNNFSWSTNVSSGVQFKLLATDWNEYVSQLQAKGVYYGYSDYSPASVSKGDVFTAVKLNGAAKVINWLVDNGKGDCTTKINGVSAGDQVTAAKINALARCLNE